MRLRLQSSQPDVLNHAFALRAIGQDLTPLLVTVLEIRIDDGVYIAHGVSLRDSGKFERKYNREELLRLDRLGRARATGLVKTPDAASLAEALRTVGRVVDSKGGRLIRLFKDQRKITFEFHDQAGAVQRDENHSLAVYQNQQEAVSQRSKKKDAWDESK